MKISDGGRETDRYLPVDIIMEILSTLPLETLYSFRLVCKSWRAIIHDRRFWKLYYRKNPDAEPIYMDVNDDVNNLDQNPFRVLYWEDGVFLERCSFTGELRLRNPITQYTHPLPDLPDEEGGECEFLKMFHLPATENYKIVYGKSGGGFRVLTVGVDLQWRYPKGDKCVNFGTFRKGEVSALPVDGVYLLVGSFHNAAGDLFFGVVCLELETENSVYTQPPPRCTFSRKVKPFRWNQKLAMANLETGMELHVWILEDYKKGIWSEIKISIPSTLFGDLPPEIIPYCANEEWLWFFRADQQLLRYNINTRQGEIEYMPPPGKILWGTYFPTLSDLNGILKPPEVEKLPVIEDGPRRRVFTYLYDLFSLCRVTENY